MKKSSSEIGIWRIMGILSQRMIFPYLYEKKLPNMKIENFKKSQKFYKKIKTNSHWNISRRFLFSPRNVPETSNRKITTSYSGRASCTIRPGAVQGHPRQHQTSAHPKDSAQPKVSKLICYHKKSQRSTPIITGVTAVRSLLFSERQVSRSVSVSIVYKL